jgi:transposase
MPFEPWQRPADAHITLRAIARRIAALTKIKTQTKNQLHALTATVETPELVIVHIKELIVLLEKQIEAHRDSALELIAQHKQLAHAFTLLSSVKGIGDASAVQILAELMILPQDMSAKQWVAHAGLDPRHFESGSSVAKKPCLSKAGNKYMRLALYMPALVAAHSETHIQAYYQHLVNDNGLKKMQALCAVMRKLLHAIHGMLKADKVFDGSRFYALPVLANS